MILEDITISDHLLCKGGIVIIVNKALHFNSDNWGSNAEAFRVERFCEKTPAHAFRGFGGGVNLCPGKGFATTEISAMVAMLIMRYNIRLVGGKWLEPGQDLTNMLLQIAPLGAIIKVGIIPRSVYVDVGWKFIP